MVKSYPVYGGINYHVKKSNSNIQCYHGTRIVRSLSKGEVRRPRLIYRVNELIDGERPIYG